MKNADPISEMRRLTAAGKAYVVNDIVLPNQVLSDTTTPGFEVQALGIEWLMIKSTDEVLYLRVSHITALRIVEL